jgi:O-antigen/teichoic acid export membrane protein
MIKKFLVFWNSLSHKIKQEFKQGKTLLQFGFLKAVGQAMGMIMPLVIAKFFSPELFGSYSLAKMVVFFFTSLLIASAQAPFIVFANQERVKTGRISKSFTVQCTFLLVSLFAFLFINLIFNKAIIAFAQISLVDLVFISLAFLGLAGKAFVANLFMALGERIKNAVVELVFGGSTLAMVLILSLTGNINLMTVFLVYFVSAVLVVVLFLKTIDFGLLLPFDFDQKYLKEMFNFAKWVVFGATAVYFINWGDNLVLRLFVPMGDIGEYNLGYQFFKGVVMLTFIINAYFLPFISENIKDSAKMRDYLFNKRPKIFVLGLAAIGLLFVIAPYFFSFVYGDTYLNSASVLRILLLGAVLILYNTFYIPILNALKKYKFTQIVIILQVLLNLLLDFLLIPLMGLFGAAVATVSAYFCWVVTIEVYFRVKLKKLLIL